MYLKASEQHIKPMTDDSTKAFFSLMELLESRFPTQSTTHHHFFVEAIQTRPLSEYFSLFAHLIFRYVYMEDDARYSILLSAFSKRASEDDKSALVTLRDEATQGGGGMLEALHKLHEDQRRLMTQRYTGLIPISQRDAQLTEQICVLKNPILPILAWFCVVEKIVGLCTEMRILAEGDFIRKELHADPIKWLLRMIPIFNLLQQGTFEKLREAIERTLALLSIPVSEKLVDEIQEALFHRECIEKLPTPQHFAPPEPGSDLGQLISSILHPEGEYNDEESVPNPVDFKEAPVSAPAAVIPSPPALVIPIPRAFARPVTSAPRARGEASLRIFVLRNNLSKLLTPPAGIDESAETQSTCSF
jgi:hypothetical protein